MNPSILPLGIGGKKNLIQNFKTKKMLNVFQQITVHALDHNAANYRAFDAITTSLEEGWAWCENQEDYTGEMYRKTDIPLAFVEEWCGNNDWEAANLLWAVEELCN